jgi:hypothetical protein
MYFGMKNYLKSNRNHTAKHTLRALDLPPSYLNHKFFLYSSFLSKVAFSYYSGQAKNTDIVGTRHKKKRSI